MRKSSLEELFRSFNRAGCRYLVAGGLAVVAHGYARLTQDADLVVDLDARDAERAVEALR